MICASMIGGIIGIPSLGKAASRPAPVATPSATSGGTTLFQQPYYTNGTYVMAADQQVEQLNIYNAVDLYSFYLIDGIYEGLYNVLPNQTFAPWLATGYTYTNLSAHPITTTNPITGTPATVNYTYNVTLRPGVQWTDWTSANSANTYTYDGITMNTHTLQAADVVISWLILQSSGDFSGTYINVVNVVPTSNLTVSFYLSAVSATFTTITLLNPILPYHIWVNHDWSTTKGAGIWNATGAPNGYDQWNMGYNSVTGTASGMVGTGPFMFTSGYGMPAGTWTTDGSWQEYVNPHYWAQYVPSLSQFAPKIYSVSVPYYSTESAAVTALTLGQVDTIEGGIDPSFISTVSAAPSTFMYYHPGSGYGFMQFNTYSAPWNITAFRQALNYAVDKTYIASVIDQGFVVTGNSIVPLSDAIWHNFSLPQYNYNPTITTSMLNNISGLSKVNGVWTYNGKPVHANIEITSQSTNPLGVEAAQLIAAEWSSLGVPTTVSQVSFIKLVADLLTTNYHQISLGITGVSGDVTSFLTAVYNDQPVTIFYQGPYSTISYNGATLNGTQVQSLLNNLTNQLNSVTNLRERISIAGEIQGIAAMESTEVILGYGVDIYPFYNGTFTGITETSLPQSAMIAFTFTSVHLKGHVAPPPAVTLPTQLHVGVVPDHSVYYDGQYGNITVQVRDQFGQPVSGMNVAIGYNPPGGILNISNTTGVTNSQGQYIFSFKVFKYNQGIYSSDYAGDINVSVAAYSSNAGVEPALGYVHVVTEPQPVSYVASGPTSLTAGGGAVPYTVTVMDPLTGQPIGGYSYSISALSGALTMTSGQTGQTVSQETSYNPLTGSGYLSVNSSGATDWNVTTISGLTTSSGTFTVDLAVNSSVNFAAMGSSFESYLFMGDYATGGAVAGSSPYVSVGELTSATNPNGFGQQQPVALPVQVQQTSAASDVNISMTVATANLNATYSYGPGVTDVFIHVSNATTGAPVPNYTLQLTAQNALGANRGYFFGATLGQQVQGFNPNEYFGSLSMPAFNVKTDANGNASALFSVGMYQTQYTNGGLVFAGYAAAPYTDSSLIPADEWQISAIGATVVNTTTITSNEQITPLQITPVGSAYVAGASILSGVNVLAGNSSHTLYVNTTENSAAGPGLAGYSVNVSVSFGTVGGSSSATGTTDSSGSFSTTLAVPNVTVMTPIVVTVRVTGAGGAVSTFSSTYYALPSYLSTNTSTTTITKNVYHNSTTTNVPVYMWGVVGVLIILTVAFAALYATRSRGGGKGGGQVRQEENRRPPSS